MTDWTQFPDQTLDRVPLYRIHPSSLHPAWFNYDRTCRFDPPASHSSLFGTCYVGLESISSYVEVFGRIGMVPQVEIDRRALSEFSPVNTIRVAVLTDRSVLGTFGVTAEHSTGSDYSLSQELAANLRDAAFDGIRYRVRHDPGMTLEALALFGEPGESPSAFTAPKTIPIPDGLIEEGRTFRIKVVPSVPLL